MTPYLTSHTKIDSRWIIDLNVKGKAVNLLDENIEAYLHDFSNRTQEALTIMGESHKIDTF